MLFVQVQQVRAQSWESVEIPQLQLVLIWTVVACPLCATTGAHGRWRSSSTVVNVPVIMQRRLYSGSASDSLHRQSRGLPVVQQRMVLDYWWLWRR